MPGEPSRRYRYLKNMVNEFLKQAMMDAATYLLNPIAGPGVEYAVSYWYDATGDYAALVSSLTTITELGSSTLDTRFSCRMMPMGGAASAANLMAWESARAGSTDIGHWLYADIGGDVGSYDLWIEATEAVSAMIDDYCEPEHMILSQHSHTCGADSVIHRAFLSVIDDDGGAVLLMGQQQQVLATTETVPDSYLMDQEVMATDAIAPSFGQVGLVEAIREIADRDLQVKLNDQGPVFSVSSGDTTE